MIASIASLTVVAHHHGTVTNVASVAASIELVTLSFCSGARVSTTVLAGRAKAHSDEDHHHDATRVEKSISVVQDKSVAMSSLDSDHSTGQNEEEDIDSHGESQVAATGVITTLRYFLSASLTVV